MTTVHRPAPAVASAEASTAATAADLPLDEFGDPLEIARAHIAGAALTPSPGGADGRVGLELEFHLVDLADPGRRPSWAEVSALAGGAPPMPAGSSVTVEPGGQLELSTPPRLGVAAAVEALRRDRAVLRQSLADAGFGAAALGADPARPVRRINPSERYQAMERHFAALGCGAPGRAMMASTAALQVNLDAGPSARWADRLARIAALGPVLVAISACSPLLGGHASGWHSMRQQAWLGIDASRSGPLPDGDPAAAWAEYALAAPMMLVRDGTTIAPVTTRIPLHAWVSGTDGPARRPTVGDLDYHLSTLFPPIRPRGYVELRCLDALPDRWWPALAALTATLVDDERAAAEVADACRVLPDGWLRAARDGLADPELRSAATTCVEVAARHCPPELRAEVEAFAELVGRGRTPGDLVRERAAERGAMTVLDEVARGAFDD